MSDFDDLDGVALPHISDDVAEQLLDGTWSDAHISQHGTNQHLADVAALFNAARTPADASELASRDATVAAFRRAVRDSAGVATIATTRPPRKKRLTVKAAAAIGVFTLATAGAAAAAGTLANPFAKEKPPVAISARSVPSTDDETDDSVVDDTQVDDSTDVTTADTGGTTPATGSTVDDDHELESAVAAEGPDVAGPATFGLCTAYGARGKHDDADVITAPESSTADALPIPFANLEAAAAAAGQTVDEFCAGATPGGSANAPGQQDGSPSATAPGQSDNDYGDGDNGNDNGEDGNGNGNGGNGNGGNGNGGNGNGGNGNADAGNGQGNGNHHDNPSVTAPGHSDGDPANGDGATATSEPEPADQGNNPSQTAPGRSGDHGSGDGAGQGHSKG